MGVLLNQLRKGDSVISKHPIGPDRVRHWKFARECDPILGGFAANASFSVEDVNVSQQWLRLQMPGITPPRFLKLTGGEFANLFDATHKVIAAKPAPNLSQIFSKLSQKQKAIADGLSVMRDARAQLKQDIASGQSWGTLAVLANAAMLPLNIIINAFDAKVAVSIYQVVVKELYAKLAKSGTRIDNRAAKESLGLIKKAVVEELKRKGLVRHIPGVNIIVGMAEDSFAFMEVASAVTQGNREMSQMLRQLDMKIEAAMREFVNMGVEMDRLLKEMETIRRTA